MNKSLINIENKIDVIHESIGRLKKLKKGEGINFNGLRQIAITRIKLTDSDIDAMIDKFMLEVYNLKEACNRM